MSGRPPAQSSDQRRAAFESTALPLMKVLYHRAMSLVRDRDRANDLVQETYLRAYRTFDNFSPGTNARAWMLTILYSVFVNAYRKEKRGAEDQLGDDAVGTFERLIEVKEPSPGTTQESKLWAAAEVHDALLRLPESFRTVLLMVEVDAFSYEEAAASLGCPIGTVRSRLARARRTLYVELKEYALRKGYLTQP